MALNIADARAVLAVIQPRVTSAVASYAAYLLNLAEPTADQLAWARQAIRDPDAYGRQVAPFFLGNQDYLDGGSGITDSDVTFVVQTAINAHFVGQGA